MHVPLSGGHRVRVASGVGFKIEFSGCIMVTGPIRDGVGVRVRVRAMITPAVKVGGGSSVRVRV